MSNWMKATAIRAANLEEQLVCPKCGEQNSPGQLKPMVTLDVRSWSANCAVCAHTFPVVDTAA